MKVTLHLEGTKMELIEQLMEFANTLAPTASVAAPVKEAKTAKRAAKEPEPEAEEPEEEIDLGEEMDEEESDEEELSLDKDVVPAFQAFVKKGDKQRAKAGKIVASYKVKSVRDIPPAKFKEVLAQLR